MWVVRSPASSSLIAPTPASVVCERDHRDPATYRCELTRSSATGTTRLVSGPAPTRKAALELPRVNAPARNRTRARGLGSFGCFADLPANGGFLTQENWSRASSCASSERRRREHGRARELALSRRPGETLAQAALAPVVVKLLVAGRGVEASSGLVADEYGQAEFIDAGAG